MGFLKWGGALSKCISLFWPTNNQYYEDLFEAWLCRAQRYILQQDLDTLAEIMNGEIQAIKYKMEQVDKLIDEGFVESAKENYFEINQELIGLHEKMMFEDAITATYTSGYYSTFLSLAASYWLNRYYVDIFSLNDEYIESMEFQLNELLLISSDYVDFIENNIIQIEYHHVNDLFLARMWVSQSLRETLALTIDALNALTNKYKIDTSSMAVPYIHQLITFAFDDGVRGDGLIGQNSKLTPLLGSNLPDSLIPYDTFEKKGDKVMVHQKWWMMKDFDNPAEWESHYNTSGVTDPAGDKFYHGNPDEIRLDGANGFSIPKEGYIKQVDIVLGKTTSESVSMNFKLDDDSWHKPHENNGLLCSYSPDDDYVVAGVWCTYSDSETCNRLVAITYLRKSYYFNS